MASMFLFFGGTPYFTFLCFKLFLKYKFQIESSSKNIYQTILFDTFQHTSEKIDFIYYIHISTFV